MYSGCYSECKIPASGRTPIRHLSCSRDCTSSFSNIFATCTSTVRGQMKRLEAISAVFSRQAISEQTSVSLVDKPPNLSAIRSGVRARFKVSCFVSRVEYRLFRNSSTSSNTCSSDSEKIGLRRDLWILTKIRCPAIRGDILLYISLGNMKSSVNSHALKACQSVIGDE